MIHDLDVVLAFIRKSPACCGVEVVGIPVLSKTEDIAETPGWCIVRQRGASPTSPPAGSRKPRADAEDTRTCLARAPILLTCRWITGRREGYITRIARDDEPESSLFKKLYRRATRPLWDLSLPGRRKIVREPVPIQKEEPLKLELQSFLQCVAARQAPVVSGESAKQALDTALEITRQDQRGRGTESGSLIVPSAEETRPPAEVVPVMLIAGEPSGDALAAELVGALREGWRDARPSVFFGAGGGKMAAAGVELVCDLASHAVVGLVEVLKNYGRFRRIFDQLLGEAVRRK